MWQGEGHAWQGKAYYVTGGHAWWMVCMAGGCMTGGMRDRGHAWVCMPGGVNGRGMHGRGCMREGMHGREGAYMTERGCMAGACMGEEGHVWQGVYGRGNAWQCGRECVAAETATAADGTYPTGMHSCWIYFQESLSRGKNILICIFTSDVDKRHLPDNVRMITRTVTCLRWPDDVTALKVFYLMLHRALTDGRRDT